MEGIGLDTVFVSLLGMALVVLAIWGVVWWVRHDLALIRATQATIKLTGIIIERLDSSPRPLTRTEARDIRNRLTAIKDGTL